MSSAGSKLGSKVQTRLNGGAGNKGATPAPAKVAGPSRSPPTAAASDGPEKPQQQQQQQRRQQQQQQTPASASAPPEPHAEDGLGEMPDISKLGINTSAAAASAIGRRDRQYSVRSLATVETLEQLELEVAAMQKQSGEAEQLLQTTPGDQLAPALRNELAQLHGNANKILATRIDAILTGELVSGKDDARAKRKALIKVVEGLIETVEAQVKRYDKARGH